MNKNRFWPGKPGPLFCAIIVMLSLAACNAEQDHPFYGGLYFSQGSYLMRLSLQDGSLSVEGHLGDSIIREISAFGGNHLLIAESASVNRRRVQRVSWIDLNTGESADLYAGTRARYLPAGNIIVYDDGSELFAVPQIDGSANRNIFSHAKNQLSSMTVVSDQVLLFESGDPGNRVIRSWNSLTNELKEHQELTALCRLQGSVWIDSLERLACKRRGGPIASAPYVLADLDGNTSGTLDLPEGTRFLALSYIAEQSALILQETVPSMIGARDQYVVWIQDVRTGERHRIPASINLGDFVVFADY